MHHAAFCKVNIHLDLQKKVFQWQVLRFDIQSSQEPHKILLINTMVKLTSAYLQVEDMDT